MLNWSGRAGPLHFQRGIPMYGRVRWLAREGREARGGREAREGRVTREGHVIHCGGVVPAWWLAIAPTMNIPRTPRGAGEPWGWPDSREGGLGPGQGRDTRNGNAPWVRQGRGAEEAGQGRPHFHIHGGIPVYGSRVKWLARGGARGLGGPRPPRDPGGPRPPRGPESFTVRGCRTDVPGLASVTRKGRWSRALGHLPHTFRPVTAHKNSSSLGS